MVAATLWAAFSRFYHIAALPPQAWVDEVWIALHARELLQTGHFFVYYKTFWGGMHPLMVDLTALVQGLGFHSVISARAVSAVGCVLTIPLAFVCFDELWRDEWPSARRQITAALAACILSNLLFVVVLSRVGYEPALIPVPILSCVWQMRRAERTGQWTSWLVAGLVLGLAQYLSHHARFFLPLLALIAVGWVELWSRISAWAGRIGAPAKWGQFLSLALAASWLGLSLGFNSYAYFALYSLHTASPAEAAAAFTTTPVTPARQLLEQARNETVFVERTPEVDDVFAFDFLFPGTPVRRLDFRQCLPLTDRRTLRTSYLVLAAQDPASASRLLQAYPSATIRRIQPEAAALMGKAVLVEVPPGAPAPAPAHAVSAHFEPGIQLLGYEWSGAKIQAGKSVFLTLYWKAEADIHVDLTAFVHVGAGTANSPLIAQHDGPPCQGLFPTSSWRAGDVIPDGFAVTIPAGAPAGANPVVTGWYTYPSLDRLQLTSADEPLSDNTAGLANLMVTPP